MKIEEHANFMSQDDEPTVPVTCVFGGVDYCCWKQWWKPLFVHLECQLSAVIDADQPFLSAFFHRVSAVFFGGCHSKIS